MRIGLTFTAGALLLVCAGAARAQEAAAADGPTLLGLRGTIDFGARGTSTEGDAARYERYRDLRSGAFSRIVLGQETSRRIIGIRIDNAGYRDQFYGVEYNGGRSKISGSFD